MKEFTLKSGKKVEADYIFVSIGNKPASGLVEQADEGAVQGGMVKVDEYLRVSLDSIDFEMPTMGVTELDVSGLYPRKLATIGLIV